MADVAVAPATPPQPPAPHALAFAASGDFSKDWLAYRDCSWIPVHALTLPLPPIPSHRVADAVVPAAQPDEEPLRGARSSSATSMLASPTALDPSTLPIARTASPAVDGAKQVQARIVTIANTQNTPITHIQPRCITFDAVTFAGLAHCVSVCTTLTTLSFWNCSFANTHVQDLASALRTSSVAVLQVDGCPITDDTAWAALVVSTAPAGAAPLVASNASEVVAGERSPVQQLSLRCNNIGDKGAAALFAKLKFNKTLVSLDLMGNRIGRDGCDTLGDALKTNSRLQSLVLARNCVCDDAVQSMLKGLCKQPLTPEEILMRKKHSADLERARQLEEEQLQQQQQEAAKKNAKGKVEKGRTGSATSKRGEDKGAGDAKAKGDSKSTGAGGNSGAGGNQQAKVKASNGDLSVAPGATGKKSPAVDAKTKSPTKPDKTKKPAGKKGEKEDAKEDGEEHDDANSPPPFDMTMFEIQGAFYNWGNRTLLSLNLSYNHITNVGVKHLLDTVLDQRRMNLLADKTGDTAKQDVLSSVGELDGPGIDSYVRTTTSGLWRVVIRGNAFDASSEACSRLAPLIELRAAAPPPRRTAPSNGGRRESVMLNSASFGVK
ncbi:hypothetical protein RI367_004869 [Sorochytrium milnesiophthora]